MGNNVTETTEQVDSAPDVESVEAVSASQFDNISDDASFADLFEDSLKVANVGEVVPGTVIDFISQMAVVDIGDKSEAMISLSEFKNDGEQLEVHVGDVFDVFVEKREKDGGLCLSREKAIAIKVWEAIAQIQADDGTIPGVIENRVKGGLSVDIGVPAFLPYSQIDLRPVKDLDAMLGQTYDFKILKYNRKRNNVVISRRAILEEERNKLREAMRDSLQEGAVIKGTITNITDYGIFVDLGGMDGLCHITDLSWGRVSHPSKMFQVGENLDVKILKFDKDSGKVSLGVKQLKEDPWSTVQERYPVGTKASGKVVSITDYGVFAELEEGVEGLAHISEMTWSKKAKHPSKLVAMGDQIEIVILNVDAAAKRISLGMKQLQPNPWDLVSENYPVGSIIEGKVKNITDFGVFIGIEEGIDGLIHVSDLSWTERIKHPSEKYSKGDTLQAVVLKIDRENERFSLGVKQLEPDPWQEAVTKYPVGSKITGKITNVTDFGVFVEVEDGIEGLVHVSEISEDKVNSPVGLYKVGNELETRVINVSAKDRKIGLSIKALADKQEDILEEYHKKQTSPSTIGDLLNAKKEEIAAQQQNGDSDKKETDA
ncbi:SSU ribosomal protein S1p [hydrothermal vent metagenome]|uniref:Small ribosomal subunit protein bS1 n=1 Tax=hydrothermal vent metagenome TaxID=652676 RepID=A0A3B0VDD5_9ZZZZ